jgi:CubicO group peptidase (beta-lactamase class C family)
MGSRTIEGPILRLVCPFALLMALSVNSVPAVGSQDVSKQIDLTFTALNHNDQPGGAVLILRRGDVALERGYGVTDLRSRHLIDAHTNFRLASVSKQFTAMAVMLLVHDGKLHYQDKLSDVSPGFPAYGKNITIQNLLNHTSGLLDYEDLMPRYDNVPSQQIPQISDPGVLELLKEQTRTKFSPGSRWDYSNSGYVVLGTIVAKISGLSFPQFLQERIFSPLGMKNTVAYVKGQNQVPNRAYGYTKVGKVWDETDQSPTSATLGDGGIYSSLQDLAKWDDALRRNTLVSAGEMSVATIPVKPPQDGVQTPDGAPADYGFGWFLNSYHGHKRMWHYGETVGFRTSIQRFIDDDLTVIVLCNQANASAIDLALKVADLELHEAVKEHR